MTDQPKDKPLSRKHRLFVDEYLRILNGTRAYMAVYPSASYESAGVQASRLLGTPKIKDAVEARGSTGRR